MNRNTRKAKVRFRSLLHSRRFSRGIRGEVAVQIAGSFFQIGRGKPMNLDALARDVIRPSLEKQTYAGMVGMRSGVG